jgi:hypothetical protein
MAIPYRLFIADTVAVTILEYYTITDGVIVAKRHDR